MRGIYLANCEDWLNLDHVLCIEFRDEQGNIPSSAGIPLLIHQARVRFVGQENEWDETKLTVYLGRSARELYKKVREG